MIISMPLTPNQWTCQPWEFVYGNQQSPHTTFESLRNMKPIEQHHCILGYCQCFRPCTFSNERRGERNSRIAKYYTLILGQSCLLCWLQWRWREFRVSLLMSCSYAAWPNWCTSAGCLRMCPSFASWLFITFRYWQVTVCSWLTIL